MAFTETLNPEVHCFGPQRAPKEEEFDARKLEVRPAGSSVVALVLPGVKLEGGTTYSVFATGLLSGYPALGVAVAVDSINSALLKGRENRPWR